MFPCHSGRFPARLRSATKVRHVVDNPLRAGYIREAVLIVRVSLAPLQLVSGIHLRFAAGVPGITAVITALLRKPVLHLTAIAQAEFCHNVCADRTPGGVKIHRQRVLSGEADICLTADRPLATVQVQVVAI